MKLRVKIKPDRSVWKWTIEGWYTYQSAEGWHYVAWAIPHDLGEFSHFEGSARNEERARNAARKALHDAAGRLAVEAFDIGLGRQQGYTVEV